MGLEKSHGLVDGFLHAKRRLDDMFCVAEREEGTNTSQYCDSCS